MTFRKFNSIVQFSNVVKSVRHYCQTNSKPLPKLKFFGSVKLHGTNACFSKVSGKNYFQSRERLLNEHEDNAGFCNWGLLNQDKLNQIIGLFDSNSSSDVYVYGEWCGQGIQKGTALNQLNKKLFAIFEVVVVNSEGLIKKINPVDFGSAITQIFEDVVVIDALVSPIEVVIDFAAPHLVQNQLLEETLKVEECCPFGKYFGIEGIGEGLVWTCELEGFEKFKTKGEKHSASKVKTVRELTDAEIAKKESVSEFVDYAVTENRLEQGISKLEEMGLEFDIKSMGAFLKWVGNDVLRECADVIEESNLDKKDIMPTVNLKAKQWFLEKLAF